MEDVLKGIVVPRWSFGSVVLALLFVCFVFVVVLVVVEASGWTVSRIRYGWSRCDRWKSFLFAVLVVTSAHRGFVYLRALCYWLYCVLRISSTPSLEVLQMGMIIQEAVWLEALRCLSHLAVYFVSYLLIRKDSLTYRGTLS